MSETFWTLLTAESQHDAVHTERAQALLLQTSWTLHSCSSSLQLTLCLSLIPGLRTRRRKPPLPTLAGLHLLLLESSHLRRL